MSLWLQSLDNCLYNCENDLDGRAKCILSHLAMDVPRNWWEQALDTGKIRNDYLVLLRDLRNELLKIIESPEHAEYGLLIALAFIDDHVESQDAKYGTFKSKYSIEEYLERAQKILINRNDLRKLVKKIEQSEKSGTARLLKTHKTSTLENKFFEIDKIDIQNLINLKSRGKIWNLGNDVLYKLCKDHPAHISSEVIIAKIWLIGRSYAAAIERGRSTEEDGDTFYETRVAPKIQASFLDQYLDKVRKFSEISPESIPTILEVHKYLTDIFAEISGKEKRSLASKYLHFHLPHLYFLYDSRADRGVKILYPRFKPIVLTKNVDSQYARFFLKLAKLRDDIKNQEGCVLSTREIDNILINIGS